MTSTVFVDSSVLFAALVSDTGHARDLVRLAIRGEVILYTSTYVLREVTGNLAKKAPVALVRFEQVLQQVEWQLVDPEADEVLAAAAYTALKDAPVVAAARKACCEYLVTYDRKHLLKPPEVAQHSGLAIVTPDVVVLAAQEDENGE